MLHALGGESEYRNDEMIDNQLRSVLFQVPRPGIPNPGACLDGLPLPDCFAGVLDLGAIDIERGRDHGVPSYSAAAKRVRTRAEDQLHRDHRRSRPTSSPAIRCSTPRSRWTIPTASTSSHCATSPATRSRSTARRPTKSPSRACRRTTLAARLRALYGDVGALDAFTGMLSEQHVPGSEFGELQLAIWKRQFEALRDGDRFFYASDPAVTLIERTYGISPRRTLAQIIEDNTDLDVADDVFKIPGAPVHELRDGGIGATVSPTLSLTLGAPASFGTLLPGVTKDYVASTTATVISTAGDAALSVADPSPIATGRLVNGTAALPQRLQAGGAAVGGAANPTPLRAWSAPASNETVAIAFTQPVAGTDALRTGNYAKALTYTLSTTSP